MATETTLRRLTLTERTPSTLLVVACALGEPRLIETESTETHTCVVATDPSGHFQLATGAESKCASFCRKARKSGQLPVMTRDKIGVEASSLAIPELLGRRKGSLMSVATDHQC